MAVDLIGVVVLNAGDDLVEQVEQLRGGGVGEARQTEGQDHGFTFHWISSSAH